MRARQGHIMKDLYTIREIAQELGTDKNVIYRLIKKLDISPSTREHSANAREHSRAPKANAAKYYDKEAVEAIITEYSKRNAETTANTSERSRTLADEKTSARANTCEHSRTLANDELINTLKAQIDNLNEQIKNQNETIKHHEKTIDNLTELLAHEQEINKAQLMISAANKPSLLERITGKFKRNKPEE